jgi:hypothetical protein
MEVRLIRPIKAALPSESAERLPSGRKEDLKEGGRSTKDYVWVSSRVESVARDYCVEETES